MSDDTSIEPTHWSVKREFRLRVITVLDESPAVPYASYEGKECAMSEGLENEARRVLQDQMDMFDETYRKGDSLGVHKREGESFLAYGKRVKDASCASLGGHDWDYVEPDYRICQRCGRSARD